MASEEWRMAKEWIRSTGAVPAASKIHTECDLIDFVQALRDGVILCEVANHIRRGAVRDFTRTTHMSAVCLTTLLLFDLLLWYRLDIDKGLDDCFLDYT